MPLPNDELEMTTSTRAQAPVWSPNPGVPIVARMLAFTFGGLMLLTIVATCLTPHAVDVPPIPGDNNWSKLNMGNRCVLYYPGGWVATLREGDGEAGREGSHFEAQFTLYPNSPVQVTAILEELPPDAEYPAVQRQHEWLETTLRQKLQLENFALSEGSLTSISTQGRAFTFTVDNQSMSGAWLIQPHGRFLLSLIGFSPREGWEQTQLIISQMATKAEFPE